MRTTLGDAKASGMAQRLDYASCSDDFVALLNKATLELAMAGLWWSNYARIRICPTANCITWPRNVMTVQAISNYGQKIKPVNQWYEFESFTGRCDRQFPISMDGDTSPIFGAIGAVAVKLRVYSNVADDGKLVIITGSGDGDHQVRSGTVPNRINGEAITLAAPYVETASTFLTVTGIQKPITQYGVGLRKWDGTTETVIGDYEPGETRPWYRRTYLTPDLARMCGCSTVTDRCETQTCAQPMLKAIVKLQPVNPVADTDWLFIPYLIGLEEMMRSISYRTKHMMPESEVARKIAIRAMREWSDSFEGGVERTLITVNSDAGANARVFAGFN
jgi:hypothetical protein